MSRAREVHIQGIDRDALFVGSAHAKFVLGLALAGIAAAMEEGMSGRVVSPRKDGARLYLTSEAAQELGRWRSSGATGKVYRKAHSEKVAPEMRVASKRASDRLEVDRYVQDLEESGALANEDKVGLSLPVYRRQLYAHFTRVSDMLEPEDVAQSRANFLNLMGRRARELNLLEEQKQTLLRRASRFKAAWRESRKEVAAEAAVTRRSDAALSSSGV